MIVHFTEIKKKLSEVTEELRVFEDTKFYIIRDIYGRISIYVDREKKDEEFLETIRTILINRIIDLHWVHSVEFVEPNSFLLYELEKIAEKIEGSPNVFFTERHITRLNWFRSKKSEKREILKNKSTKVVTFYSFKGGLGRTTSLVLTALQLVRKGKKVVVIDFDLEAPGLASLLIPGDGLLPKYGVLDYLLESQVYGEDYIKLDIDDYVYSYYDKRVTGSEGGELYVFPASDLTLENTEEYLEKMGRIDFGTPSYFKEDNPIKRMLLQVTERFSPDFIFLDARTGINDVGGLMLTQFSDVAVLLFYGNEQNMAGMKIVLPKVMESEIPFFLINGPVPIAEKEAEEETSFFLEHTYNTFIESGYYSEFALPDILDKNAEHYPFIVDYNPAAMLINSVEKIRRLLEDNGDDNVYLKLAEQIATYSTEEKKTEVALEMIYQREEILKEISNIMNGDTAASEYEFQNDQDLKSKFYPLREHRFIFEADKFLILGSKGSGKTALFSVLEHPNYARDLASFVGLSLDSIRGIHWVTGLKQRAYAGEFPTKENFEAVMKEGDFSLFRRYWRLLALRSIYRQLKDEITSFPERIKEAVTAPLSSIREKAKNVLLAEEIEEFIQSLDEHLKQENKKIVIVYDGLDVLFEKKYRGRMIAALISLWYEYLPKYQNIRVKIFLREDIFRNEVKEIADKVKLRNYSVDLSWTFDELLAMVWKRMAERSEKIAKIFESALKPLGILFIRYDNLLGYVPRADEQANKAILKSLVGERMGTGKAAFSFNWIKNHLADTNEEIVPRSILKLFATAARKESEQTELIPSDVLIKPKSFQDVMEDVSDDRVTDLLDEYSEYREILLGLKDYLPSFPANEDDLREALRKCGVEEGKERTIIDELVEIGVMKPYQRRKSDPIRYHIPDIFLIGLGLSRRGPWAYKQNS